MAFGQQTFSDFSGAASDIFSSQLTSESLKIKAQGDLAEARSYDMAAKLALLNEQYTKTETAVKEAQNEREIYQTISQQRAGRISAPFAVYMARNCIPIQKV